jgi:hypothetical protein
VKWAGDPEVLVLIIALLIGALWLVAQIKFRHLPEGSIGWASWA